jgi:hypothetical protein
MSRDLVLGWLGLGRLLPGNCDLFVSSVEQTGMTHQSPRFAFCQVLASESFL